MPSLEESLAKHHSRLRRMLLWASGLSGAGWGLAAAAVAAAPLLWLGPGRGWSVTTWIALGLVPGAVGGLCGVGAVLRQGWTLQHTAEFLDASWRTRAVVSSAMCSAQTRFHPELRDSALTWLARPTPRPRLLRLGWLGWLVASAFVALLAGQAATEPSAARRPRAEPPAPPANDSARPPEPHVGTPELAVAPAPLVAATLSLLDEVSQGLEPEQALGRAEALVRVLGTSAELQSPLAAPSNARGVPPTAPTPPKPPATAAPSIAPMNPPLLGGEQEMRGVGPQRASNVAPPRQLAGNPGDGPERDDTRPERRPRQTSISDPGSPSAGPVQGEPAGSPASAPPARNADVDDSTPLSSWPSSEGGTLTRQRGNSSAPFSTSGSDQLTVRALRSALEKLKAVLLDDWQPEQVRSAARHLRSELGATQPGAGQGGNRGSHQSRDLKPHAARAAGVQARAALRSSGRTSLEGLARGQPQVTPNPTVLSREPHTTASADRLLGVERSRIPREYREQVSRYFAPE